MERWLTTRQIYSLIFTLCKRGEKRALYGKYCPLKQRQITVHLRGETHREDVRPFPLLVLSALISCRFFLTWLPLLGVFFCHIFFFVYSLFVFFWFLKIILLFSTLSYVFSSLFSSLYPVIVSIWTTMNYLDVIHILIKKICLRFLTLNFLSCFRYCIHKPNRNRKMLSYLLYIISFAFFANKS